MEKRGRAVDQIPPGVMWATERSDHRAKEQMSEDLLCNGSNWTSGSRVIFFFIKILLLDVLHLHSAVNVSLIY